MPFKAMNDLAKNEQIVKTLFDHLRNLGICAVVFAAGNWNHQQSGTGWAFYSQTFASWMLYGAAFCLFFINMEFALHKLRTLTVPRWIRFFLVFFYLSCAVRIFTYLIQGR